MVNAFSIYFLFWVVLFVCFGLPHSHRFWKMRKLLKKSKFISNFLDVWILFEYSILFLSELSEYFVMNFIKGGILYSILFSNNQDILRLIASSWQVYLDICEYMMFSIQNDPHGAIKIEDDGTYFLKALKNEWFTALKIEWTIFTLKYYKFVLFLLNRFSIFNGKASSSNDVQLIKLPQISYDSI